MSILPSTLNLTGQIRDVSGPMGAITTDAGGFSAVRMAQWYPSNRRTLSVIGRYDEEAPRVYVAVKTLKIHKGFHGLVEEKLNKRFYREARVWMMLSHECIAPFLGYVEEPDGPGLVSLWYSRGNLVHYISQPYHRSINREILCYDVADGLNYLHSYTPPIIHGDLKGANVLIDPDGRACLCDFGLSLVLDGLSTGYTTSEFGGSLRFLAPELLDNRNKTTATDIYAFGCLCIEALLDAVPYEEHTQESTLIQLIIDGVSPYPLEDNSFNFLLITKAVLTQCWERDPDLRPTASKLVDAFRTALMQRHQQALSLRETFGDPGETECTLISAATGKSYLALMTSISHDRTSVQFTKLEDDDEGNNVSIRIHLYRKVEWLWEVNITEPPPSFPETSALKGSIQSPRAGISMSRAQDSQPSITSGLSAKLAETRIDTETTASQKGPGRALPLLWADDDWDLIAPMFRSASNNILGVRDKNITWQEYVRSVSAAKNSRFRRATDVTGMGIGGSGMSRLEMSMTQRNDSNELLSPDSRRIVGLGHVRGTVKFTEDIFGKSTHNDVEFGKRVAKSLPESQARSPTFSRIEGFDA